MKTIIEDFLVFIKKNKMTVIASIFAMGLAYGFFASTFTYNKDQLLFDDYYNGTILITAGRWFGTLLNQITNWMTFAPFWSTMLFCVILLFSSLLWCFLFYRASEYKTDKVSVSFFVLFFVSYPVIKYQLTFPNLSIVIPYLLVAMTIILITSLTDVYDDKKIFYMALAIAFLTISVDMYESHVSTYIVGVLGFGLISVIFGSDIENKKVYRFFAVSLFVLIMSLLFDLMLSKIICKIVTGSYSFSYSENSLSNYFGQFVSRGIVESVSKLVKSYLVKYIIACCSNLSVFVFLTVSVIMCVIGIIVSFNRKNMLIVILIFGMIVSSQIIGIIRCEAQQFRMAQSVQLLIPVFVFVIVSLVTIQKCRFAKVIVFSLFTVTLFNQTLDINRYSLINYEKYSYENRLINEVATDLKSYPISKKPLLVVYNNEYEFPKFTNVVSVRVNNRLSTSVEKFYCKVLDRILPEKFIQKVCSGYKIGGNNCYSISSYFEDFNLMCNDPILKYNTDGSDSEVHLILKLNGCNVTPYDASEKVESDYEDLPAYPNAGYIKEEDNYIVVKIY